MEKFKLEIYKNDRGEPFPMYRSLNSIERKEIITEIANIIELQSSVELFKNIESKLLYEDYDEEFTYSLECILDSFGFSLEGKLFVVWNANDIDEFSIITMREFWEYIWYGNSDEAVILYQQEFCKVIMITHYGRVFYKTS
jgi:hypothetical protein